MANKNITITLTEEEMDKLEDLVALFQKQSISQVTRTDVIKFFIVKNHDLLQKFSEGSIQEDTLNFFKAIGLDLSFRVD